MPFIRVMPSVGASLLLLAVLSYPAMGESPVDFNRDIRPILAAKCFACHGPDEEHREADLRLDDRDAAIDHGAIVPGAVDESVLIERIMTDDADLVMPPPQANDVLKEEQKQLLSRWIQQGAKYAKHWAFVPPVKPPVPLVGDTAWPRNAIDHFVLAKLEQEKLTPSPEADRYTLVRRVYLDLIGLPPTPEEADAFVRSEDPAAYEKLVDQLLASPRYGERWGREWLDLARYSDTNGYEKDRERSIWPYRDWVIRAINDDMPFDQFTIEQIAGDMLPDATPGQRIATGFHRNTMLNEEGGIDPLEYRFYAMVDRVATTGTVWLGMTTGCAQCHTHKYDPITHTDYYSLMALMNNADEPDLVIKPEALVKRTEEIQSDIRLLEDTLVYEFPPIEGEGSEDERRAQNFEQHFQAWLAKGKSEAVAWQSLKATHLKTNLPLLEQLPDNSILSTGDITKRDVFQLFFALPDEAKPVTAIRLEVLPDDRLPAGGPGRAYYEGRKGDFFLSELSARIDGKPVPLQDASHDYGKIAVGSGSADAANVLDGEGSTGWSTAEGEGKPHQLVINLAEPIAGGKELRLELLFERHFAASLGRFRISVAHADKTVAAKQMPMDIEAILARDESTWTAAEKDRLQRHFIQESPDLAEARKAIDVLKRQLPNYPTTMVLEERPVENPRTTHLHHRGEYLSPKQEVEPNIPAFLREGEATGPANRLEFARWLVSPQNPLVARVTVNRYWQAIFGKGLVESSGDFGTQSEPPSHPDLLDYLACQFMEEGWSRKKLLRTIVLSATYRQSSVTTPELKRRDPSNRLLARGPRFRIDAELVRDTMLKSSGLLSEKMFGHGVYPPQPESVTALAYGNVPWNASTGEDRYRRSIYTFSKRTTPFASYTVFDAPTGEVCTAGRDRSNTPLQALTLLNDEMYLELARHLAEEVVTSKATEEEMMTAIFRRLLTRPPEPAEVKTLLAYYHAQLARIEQGELEASLVAGNDQASQQQAAWAMVARVLMNVDEAIAKP
ncbi:PSD1 and planctomycete cytochrome C domain-containing protein [Blastopirellula marina]|uniref:Cytochrome c domain-containing protein n=1 Tax=Blastopirellula marina TaxID=124 RepID=A0A2S8F9N0_9BACT|nr:PSD1 and planctomycete cytochrome C domain-containing protein [Blastopirellula marina]PQO28845.1 hypothetical protein C5Y98_24065 [Blastopirellula marina]PTL42118.1 DUF1553 domain-containing protein [Blastopirellula marina]